ncbi:MAG: translocation/assembly module TamB domain-containing protein [Pseudomonadota bacterium]
MPRWLRRIGLVVAAVLAAVLVLVGGSAVFLHSAPGERFLAGLVEDAVPEVAIDGLDLGWPFVVSAGAVRVSDRDGVWLRIERPVIDWHPLAVTRRVLDIDRLAAERVVVQRLPRAGPETGVEGGGGFDPSAYVLRLDALEAPVVFEEPALGERVELLLVGTFRMVQGGGEVDVSLRTRGGDVARLEGEAGRDYLDLRWYLTVPRLARWQRLAGVDMAGRLAAGGTIAGRLPRPAVTAEMEAGRGAIAGVGWSAAGASLRAVPGPEAWHVAARLGLSRPSLDGEPLPAESARLAAAFSLFPDLDRLRIESARLAAAGMEVTAQGVVEAWGRRADLRLGTGSLDPSLLLERAGGSVAVSAHVTGDLREPDLRATVRMHGRRLTTGIAVLDRLLGTDPEARAVVAVEPGWRPDLVSATVDGARASAQASGTVWPRLDLRATLSVADLSVFAETLSGAGVARGRVRGEYDSLATWGVARVDGLAAAGGPAADGRVGFDFSDLTGTPDGTVTADITVLGRPLDGRARVVVAEPLRIEDLSLSSAGSRVEGSLTVAEAGVSGRLRGRVPDLAGWGGLLGLPVAGALRAEAVLDPARGQSVRIDARAERMAAAGVTARSARLRAVVHGLVENVSGQAALTASGVERGGLRFDRLRAEASGDPGAFRFAVAGDGAAELSAAGSAELAGPRGAARLERLRLEALGTALRLAAPTRVAWGPDGVLVEPTRLALAEGGMLAGRGGVVRGRLDGSATLSDVPLSLLELLAPGLEAVGQIDGTVTVGGTPEAPLVEARLRGTEVGFAAAAEAGIGRMAATLEASWSAGRLRASATARDGDRLRLAASMTSAGLSAIAPLSGRVEVAGDLGRLTDALPLAGHAFAGRLEGAAALAGTLGDPRLDGRFVVTDGRYENLETGTVVAGLSATARLDGSRVAIEARGTDGRDGTARLDAAVDLGATPPSWRGDVDLVGFRAVRRDDLRATVSADLRLEGEGREGRLAGTAVVEGAELDVGRLQGAGPVTLDVVEVNKPGAAADSAGPAGDVGDETGPLTVALAIAVKVERAFVRGRGLDSEWGGDLRVDGTLSDPDLAGRLVAERGRFEVFGRNFRLAEDSAVEFTGEGTSPRLDVAAEAKAEEIVARVEVSGTAEAPILDVTSTPPLPRDEVLSRVLFGTEAGNLSAFQQIQLAQMAATGLTGRGEGFDPVGGLRGLLGLDVLEVGQGEEGGAAVSAGKYIGEETFLRVEQGTQDGGRVTVERELGGGFSVTTEVGQERGGGVGVEWRKDY